MTTTKIVKKIYKNGQEYLIYGSGGAALPEGGTTGQVLTKTNDGADWEDPTGGIGSSNNTYDNIIHLSQADYDDLQNKDPETLYSTPDDESGAFEPENQGSTGQVLKKTSTGYAYADSVLSGDTGVNYTLKVSSSAPASGTASSIITIVTD